MSAINSLLLLKLSESGYKALTVYLPLVEDVRCYVATATLIFGLCPGALAYTGYCTCVGNLLCSVRFKVALL